MFGTVAHTQAQGPPEEGPEISPVVREQRLRDWIKKQTLNEERLEFNKDFPAINQQFQARHDKDFILPDAFSQIRPVPKQPELHGLYSVPVAGEIVPGVVDPRYRPGILVNSSDLLQNNLERGTGSIAAVPRKPGMGDMLSNDKLLGALKKMLFKGTAEDKDLNMREANQFFGRPWRGV